MPTALQLRTKVRSPSYAWDTNVAHVEIRVNVSTAVQFQLFKLRGDQK